MAEGRKSMISPREDDHPIYITLLKTCSSVSRLLISNPDFEEALGKITEIIAGTLLFDRVYICEVSHQRIEIERYFLTEKGNNLIKTAMTGEKESLRPDLLKKIYPVLERGESVCISKYDHPRSEYSEMLPTSGLCSYTAIPVATENSCWGVIVLENYTDKYIWDEKSLSVFKNIATSLGLFFKSHSQRLDLIVAKEIAQESEYYATSLFEQSPLGMAYISVNGTLEKVNKAFELQFGVKNEVIAGKFNLNKDPVAMILKWDQIFADLVKGDTCPINGVKFNPSDFGVKGPSLQFNISPFQIRVKGKVKKIALVFKDISDIVRNESLLMIQRNLAYAILNSKTVKEFLSVAAFELSRILDITGIYIAQLYNKSDYLSITGYINKFHKNWTEPHKGSLEGYVYDSEHSVLVSREEIFDLCQKGEINFHGNIPALWMGVPFSGENSSCGVIAVVNMENQNAFSKTDLSIIELIANETKIFLDKKRSEENTIKITKAITESPSSIIITDRMGVIEYVNPKFTSLTGYTPEEVIGGKPSILKSGDTPDLIYKSLWGTITSGQEWRGELKNRKKSGDFYWEDVSISPVFDDNGYISHYVAVKEDITDRRQLISELIRARDKAEESDRLKTSFIQNISHEMRTPMNGVMGFIDLLRDNSLMDSERMEFLDTIEKCGNRMLYIINDLIDISKIEAGIMQVNRRNFKPKDLLRDLVNFFTPEAGKDGLTLIMKADNIDNLEITSDYEKIYAALSNLIKNAIKFTDKGRVSLRAELNRDTIDFIVTDTGIGIPEQAQKKIFDRFARVDNSNIKRYEGTGLGLSIVKGYAELLGGSVEVESEEGSGSAFRFTIPLGQHAPDGENNLSEDLSYSNITEHREKEMTKVLIAEDEETNRLYLKTLLKKRNYELITATNGKEAVDLFAQNRDIRLVLMDIRMPVMDGYEATREIREMDKDVVIIAQTAYASAADREKVIEAGCNGYILKPIRKEELFEVIDSLLTEN